MPKWSPCLKPRMLLLAALLFFLSTVLPEAGFVTVAFASDSVSQDGQGQILLAKKRKKKKRKKKKRKKKKSAPVDGDESTGDTAGAAAAAGTVHAEQEGQDAPYKWQVSLLSDFAINNEQTGDVKTGNASYALDGKGMYIIAQSIEVGGQLEFREVSTKFEEDTVVSRQYVLFLLAAYNFGNLDQDDMVFFVQLGFGFGSDSTKSETIDSSASITKFGLGLGLHYFIDSNVAFTAEFSFDSGSKKDKDAEEPTKTTTIHIARMGFSLFI